MPSLFDLPRVDLPHTTVPRWRVGERLDASKLNRTVHAVNVALQGLQSARNVYPGIPELPGVVVRQFKLVGSGSDDKLLGQEIDSAGVIGDNAWIAKPYLLRYTPFHEQTRNGIEYTYSSYTQRTADDGEDTETQVVVPSYVSGDLIYAVRGVVGGTTVTLSGTPPPPVEWLDLNVDSRAWAKKTGT
jgi:hypothetical protein